MNSQDIGVKRRNGNMRQTVAKREWTFSTLHHGLHNYL
jgi:hypothetical protein